MKNIFWLKQDKIIILILALWVFWIINTEMWVVGIIPLIAETFNVSVAQAWWTVSIFALIVAISAPILPLLCSWINRKKIMLVALWVFVISNITSALTTNFIVLLIARAIPAFFHPLYVSMAFSLASSSVSKEDSPKAVSRIFIWVSAWMVLWVPITSYIASETSFSLAMYFFALVNILVFLATIFFIPSIPVKEKLSYWNQLKVLKKSIVWESIIAVTCINAWMFWFFSYFSDFLKNITSLSFKAISIVLFIYWIANIIWNLIAWKLLANIPSKTIKFIPIIMILVYIVLFILWEQSFAMILITLILWILAWIASNNSQYMISTSAREAPDFANGLFLTSANLWTTIGTAVCGLFISYFYTRYSVIWAIIFMILWVFFIFIRSRNE